mmetsp:Transcript_44891/g.54370  ORF Transcript_44891/g.54370 Transcript_44891/m.54370 type:complete len:148 (-) Transcript_44891:156-599(-)
MRNSNVGFDGSGEDATARNKGFASSEGFNWTYCPGTAKPSATSDGTERVTLTELDEAGVTDSTLAFDQVGSGPQLRKRGGSSFLRSLKVGVQITECCFAGRWCAVGAPKVGSRVVNPKALLARAVKQTSTRDGDDDVAIFIVTVGCC